MKAGLTLLSVFCLAVLCGCNGGGGAPDRMLDDKGAYPWELGAFEGLSAETEWRVVQDYCKYQIEKEQAAVLRSSADSWGENWEENPLYRESVEKLMKEIAEYTSVNDFWVGGYYGAYNGGVVVIVLNNYLRADVITTGDWYVADIRFYYDYLFPPEMWKDGRFYALQEAYDLGLLAREDLQSIAGRVNARYEG
jgi:hypothetical protein